MNSCLEILLSTSSHNIAVAASREHALINESEIYCFRKPNNIFVYPVAALAHEHYHLLEPINHQIQKVIEAGLINKWVADSKLMKKSKIVTNTVYPFSFQNISGCIIELIGGLTLACILFGFELYFQAKKNSVQNSQPAMWRLCEKFCITTERNGWKEIVRYFRWKN